MDQLTYRSADSTESSSELPKGKSHHLLSVRFLAHGRTDRERYQSQSIPTSRSGVLSPGATSGSTDADYEIIPLLSNFASTRRDPQLPCCMMPLSPNKEFFGRTEALESLEKYFFSKPSFLNQASWDFETNQTRAFAICGPGGMGKTQLAAEFVFSHKDRFDAVFWICADQAAKLAEGFGRMALELGLISQDSVNARDQVVTRDVVKGWLAHPLKSSDPLDEKIANLATWLLVFDNVDDLAVLDDFWPLDGPGCVLFTGRDPLAKGHGYLAIHGIDLGPFSTEEASDFLMRLTKKDELDEREVSKSVANRLGGLPLAMTQMAGVIIRRDLTFSEFLRTYDEEESRLELFESRFDRPVRRSGYEHTLASVWALESLKHGAVLLDVLSFLDPDGIQEYIITSHPEIVSLESFPRTTNAYQVARTELLQCSLIFRDKTSKKILSHRLIQDAARAKMKPKRFREVFSTTVMLLSSVWPFEEFSWRHGVARWQLCEELFPHILRLQQFASRLTPFKESLDADLELARLLTDAGW